MRLKKLMSLVLACAMALSLVTVASAADTRIYFIEDFSGYETANDYFYTAAYDNAQETATVSKTAPEGAVTFWGRKTTNSGSVSNYSKFVTNSFGSKAYQLYTDELAASADHSSQKTGNYVYTYHLDQAWDFAVNTDETFVITYEYTSDQFAGITSTLHNYAGTMHTYFTNSDKSATSSFSMLRERTTAGTAASGTEGEEGYVAATRPDTYIVNFPDGQGGASQIGTNVTPTNGTTIRTAVGISYNTATNPYRYYAVDGELKATGTVDRSKFTAATKLYAFDKWWYGHMKESIANIKAYTIKTDDFKVTAETATDVPVTAKTMRIYFSNIVSPATYAAPVVKADGEPLAEGTYNVGELKNVIGDVGGEIYSYVDITFDSLKEGTTYTVEFPETITNEIGTTLEGKNVATFTTKYPDVKFNNLAVVGAANLVANGSLQKAKIVLENTTSASKAVAVIYAVYSANGQLADVVYVNDEIVANETAEIEVELKYAAAGTAKSFVWDNMSALRPYTGAQQLTIAAAAE